MLPLEANTLFLSNLFIFKGFKYVSQMFPWNAYMPKCILLISQLGKFEI